MVFLLRFLWMLNKCVFIGDKIDIVLNRTTRSHLTKHAWSERNRYGNILYSIEFDNTQNNWDEMMRAYVRALMKSARLSLRKEKNLSSSIIRMDDCIFLHMNWCQQTCLSHCYHRCIELIRLWQHSIPSRSPRGLLLEHENEIRWILSHENWARVRCTCDQYKTTKILNAIETHKMLSFRTVA